MPKAELRNTSVSRVELDHRARAARLQLERAEQLLVPVAAARSSWLRRAFARRFGIFVALAADRRTCEGAEQDAGSTGDMSGAANGPDLFSRARGAGVADAPDQAEPTARGGEAEGCAQVTDETAGELIRPAAKSARSRRLGPHRPSPLRRLTCHSAAMSGYAPHGRPGSAVRAAAARRRRPDRKRGGRLAPARQEAALVRASRLRLRLGMPQFQQRAVGAWEQTEPPPPGVL